MAFKISLEDKTGCTHPEAYARVSFFAFDENGKQMRIVLNVYHSAAAKAAGKAYLVGEDIEINISAQDAGAAAEFAQVMSSVEQYGPKKVAYVLAKRLDRLASAEDVLDSGQVALTEAEVNAWVDPRA